MDVNRLRSYARLALPALALTAARKKYRALMPIYRKATWRGRPPARRRGYKKRRTYYRRPYRKYGRTRKKMCSVGFPVRKGISKRCQTALVDGPFDSISLQSRDLTAINLATSAAGHLNDRRRDIVNIRGFKLMTSWKLNDNHPGTTMVCVALIAERGNGGALNTFGPSADTFVSTSDFFRGNGDTRQENFSNAMTGTQILTTPINNDKYVVLWRRRIKLLPPQTSLQGHVKETVAMRNWYIPMKRQVRYDELNTDLAVAGRVALVWWIDQPGRPATTGLAISNIVRLQMEAVTYFHEYP